MSLFSDSELQDIADDIREIVEDTSVNTEIIYRQFTGGTFSVTTQAYAGFTDWSGVSAIRGLVTLKEMGKVEGIEIGDSKFVFMRSDVSGTVGISDVIYDTESGTTYNVIKLGYDPLNIVNICYGRV